MKRDVYAAREREKLREVARAMKRDGYDVIVEPEPPELPPGLRDFRPDLIASRGDEKVVVEIKSSATLADSTTLPSMTRAVESLSGWRLELIVTNPRSPSEEGERGGYLTEKETLDRLLIGAALRHEGRREAGFLMSWLGVESAMRLALTQVDGWPKREMPAYLIKRLYSLAAISKVDRQVLEQALSTRNRLLHGYRISPNELELTGALVGIGSQILADQPEIGSR